MRAVTIARATLAGFTRDRGTLLAAGIAYYTLLSTFPMILGLLAIVGSVLSEPTMRERLVRGMAEAFPGSETLIARTVADASSGREAAGLVAVLALLWSASGVFSAISTALDAVLHLPHRRSIVRSILVAIGLVLGVGVIFVVSLLVSAVVAFLTTAGALLPTPWPNGLGPLIAVLSPVISLLVTFAVFTGIYRFAPSRPMRWSMTWPGAVLASVFFEASKLVFVWYLNTVAHLNAVYGPVGTVVAFVTWAYYAAVILLLGAELNVVLARQQP